MDDCSGIVELIDFKYPRKGKLYIPSIRWAGSEEELYVNLRESFGKFGLIHKLLLRRSTDDKWYCYVTFYSSHAAIKAKTFLNGKLAIGGKVCAVHKAGFNMEMDPSMPLSKNKCEELANYYLGFNGWNTQIMYHQMETVEETSDGIEIKYGSAIRLSVQSLAIDGVGLEIGTYQEKHPESKAKTYAYVGKCSLNNALRNAFSKLIITVINGKKVMPVVDALRRDPFVYNPLWDRVPAVCVNCVDYPNDLADDVKEL